MKQAVYYSAKENSMKPILPPMTEIYIPLWVYSSGSIEVTGGTTGWVPTKMLPKGSTTWAITTNQNSKLHTLNPNWKPDQKFALEVSLSSLTTAGYTTNAVLYDFTSGDIVSASQVSVVAVGNFTVVRSGAFNLVPGRTYGIAVWSNASNGGKISKAHLIALL